MEVEVTNLARRKKCVDLCLEACRKRQSPRTGFVHYFSLYEEFTDTIPLYENFCFALALYRQKTVESAIEGKDLIDRLLAFQTEEGNFPVYLHDFPKCKDRMQGLKIAPLLIQLQRRFSSILSPDFKERLALGVQKILRFSEDKAFGPWQERFQACASGRFDGSFNPISPSEWADFLITAQLTQGEHGLNLPPFHSDLQVLLNPKAPQIQEGFEPKPHLLEWLFAEAEGHFSKRLLRDHPLQMHLGAFFPIRAENSLQEPNLATLWTHRDDAFRAADLLRILWGKDPLNSFVAPQSGFADIALIGKNEWEILFDLPEDAPQNTNDLFEVLFYCNASMGIELFINGKKGIVFGLNDQIKIQSSEQSISLSFELISGSGDFCGHFSKANRPSQVHLKNFAAYDWQIGLRTLRRTPRATLRCVCKVV